MKKGFTLIELLVVIAIMAILVGLAIPAIGYVSHRAKVAAAAFELNKMSTALSMYQNTIGKYPPGDGTEISTKTLVKAIKEDYKKITREEIFEFTDKNLSTEGVWVNPYGKPFFYRENASKKDADKKEPPDMFHQDTFDIWTFMSDSEKKIEQCEVNNWGGIYKPANGEPTK